MYCVLKVIYNNLTFSSVSGKNWLRPPKVLFESAIAPVFAPVHFKVVQNTFVLFSEVNQYLRYYSQLMPFWGIF